MKRIFFFSVLVILAFAFVMAKEYNGPGEYKLMPGDSVELQGYTATYFSYQISDYDYLQEPTSGPIATLSLFTAGSNISDYSNSIPLTNLGKEETEGIYTWSNGYYFILSPLKEGSEEITVKIEEGSLSVCQDNDAYKPGETFLEESEGFYGRNYYTNGTVVEVTEDINGRIAVEKIDSCIDGKLTEYFCHNNKVKTEEKDCVCNSAGSCEEGSLGLLDSVTEFVGEVFGRVN